MADDILRSGILDHPWALPSIYDYQFFCCPECAFKVSEKQDFIDHAYVDHPGSVEGLSQIQDGSLCDIFLPWRSGNNDAEPIKEEHTEDKIDALFTKDYDESNLSLSEIDEFDSKRRRSTRRRPTKPESDSDDGCEDTDEDYSETEEKAARVKRRADNDEASGRPRVKYQRAPKIVCDICDSSKKYESVNELEDHVAKAHVDKKSKFSCENCDSIWSTVHILDTHYFVAHKERRYTCEICLKVSSSKRNRSCHVLQVHQGVKIRRKETCSLCQWKGTTMKDHWDENHPDVPYPFKCAQCDYRSMTRTLLTRHIRNLHCEKPESAFQCDQCPYMSSNQTIMRRHIESNHLKIKNFQCDLCPRSFYQKSLFQEHLVKIHRQELSDPKETKRIKRRIAKVSQGRGVESIKRICQKCQQPEFATITEFNDHVLQCYGEELNRNVEFRCKFCQMLWNSAEVLRYHLFIEHQKPNAVCDICALVTPTMYTINVHKEKTHFTIKDLSCKKCGKEFPNNDSLKKHDQNVHLKIYKYLCDKCDYKCQTVTALKIHAKGKHTDNPEFNCTHCEFVAPKWGTVSKHIRREHSKLPIKNWKKKKAIPEQA